MSARGHPRSFKRRLVSHFSMHFASILLWLLPYSTDFYIARTDRLVVGLALASFWTESNWNYNVRDFKSPSARCSASECSHFRNHPIPYLAPVRISWWYLKRFKSYRNDKQTDRQTNPLTHTTENNLRYRCVNYNYLTSKNRKRKFNTKCQCRPIRL